MTDRSLEERVRAVWAVVHAARRAVAAGDCLVAALTEATGLSREGVQLALAEHLELGPSADEVAALVRSVAPCERVTVILSANVLVGALRAIALARAAAGDVVVRPSSRDPVLARAIVRELGLPSVRTDEALRIEDVPRGELHVYGRDETIALARSLARPGVTVRGHGAGMGVAWIAGDAELVAAAEALARDVVPFDQRGCLSPRVALVEGDRGRAMELARILGESLDRWESTVPRGAVTSDERAAARRFTDTMRVVGDVVSGATWAVGVVETSDALPPIATARHVAVVPVTAEQAREWLARAATAITVVGHAGRELFALPEGARRCALGRMQRPPLDGPVDRRGS